MTEGGPAGGGAAATDNVASNGNSRSKRAAHRQRQQQQQQQEAASPTRPPVGSKRRRGAQPEEIADAPADTVADDVEPPPAKQSRGLYGRVSGLVGRAVGLLTPGRPRRPAPVAAAAEEADDLEAGRGTAEGEGRKITQPDAATPAGGEAAAAAELPDEAVSTAAAAPLSALVTRSSRSAATASVATAPPSRHGVADGDDNNDGGVADANSAGSLLFSPGIVARRSEGPRRQTRGSRAGRNGNAPPLSSSRRVSGDGLGAASLRGSTAGDSGGGGGGIVEFGLPPVPPFYPLGGSAATPSAGRRVAAAGRSGREGAGGAYLFGGGGAGPARLTVVETPGQKSKKNGKGRGGNEGRGGTDELPEEEDEEEREGGEPDGEGGYATHTSTETRDLYRSVAYGPRLSAWESLYLLGQLPPTQEVIQLKERCLQKYRETIAAAAANSVTAGTQRLQHPLGRRRRPRAPMPLLRPVALRKAFPPGADLLPLAPQRPSVSFMQPPPPRQALGFPAASSIGGSQGLFGGGGGGGRRTSQFGTPRRMPPPPAAAGGARPSGVRWEDSNDLLTPAKRAQVEAERDGRER